MPRSKAPQKAPARRRPRPSYAPLEPLVDEALRMRRRAYAPYSRFRVGAALLGESDRIYLGCNVENSSYGLSICAERTAVVSAIAEGEKTFKGIVVATQSEVPSPPCGMCLQTLREFAGDLPVLLVNHKGERLETTLSKLLPHSFTPDYL